MNRTGIAIATATMLVTIAVGYYLHQSLQGGVTAAQTADVEYVCAGAGGCGVTPLSGVWSTLVIVVALAIGVELAGRVQHVGGE